MQYKKYLIIFILLFFGCLLSITLINYVVDPFEIFNSKKIAGFNKDKPESNRRQRLSKAYVVEKNCPDNLIMGNSRALAISQTYTAWPNNKTYNYALTSASMYETYRYFQHAVASCDIKLVLLSLDFLMFEKDAGSPAHFKERRLRVNKDGLNTTGRFNALLQDSIPSLLSLSAFKASIRTVKNQTKNKEKIYYCSAPQKQHNRILKEGGHYQFIHIENRALYKKLSRFSDNQYRRLSLEFYTKLLEQSYNSNIRIILFIPPSHATLYETLKASGFLNTYTEWKRNIILINEHVASQSKKHAYSFYDFSGYNSFSTEEIPPKSQPEIGMKWFWEALHFKEELGYHILDKVFDHKRQNCKTPDDFGLKIQSTYIKQTQQIQDKRQNIYISNHPEISDIINSYKSEREKM